MPASAPCPIRIAVIANPVSARDVRRILSNAAGLTLGERANMLLRLLHTLAACAVDEVWLMPEREGLRALLERQLQRSQERALPKRVWLEMPVQGNINDTLLATRLLCQQRVKAIMILGGDGTHRAVAKHCGSTPVVGISSGTNNAFPPLREITVTALAAGLFAQGRIPATTALRANKVLRVQKRSAAGALRDEDIALINIGILNEQILGAKAIGGTDTLRTILVTQASPEAVGLSAVAAMLHPLDRHAAGGMAVELQPSIGLHAVAAAPARRLQVALAPGLIGCVRVLSWHRLEPNQRYVLRHQAGLLSLDGERELSFRSDEEISISVAENAFYTLDVPACLHYAARHHLLLD